MLADKVLRGMLHMGAIDGCDLASRHSSGSSVDPAEVELLETMRSAGFVDVDSGTWTLTPFGLSQVRSSRALDSPILVKDIVADDSEPLERRSSFELIQRLADEGWHWGGALPKPGPEREAAASCAGQIAPPLQT